jgi:toxin ParE1/3/4
MEVFWLEESVEDLKEIGRHIKKDNPIAAYQVLIKIKATGDSLQHNPELGRLGRIKKTRELAVAGLTYILPYYIKENQIRILAVLHTSRKWPDTFINQP